MRGVKLTERGGKGVAPDEPDEDEDEDEDEDGVTERSFGDWMGFTVA